MSFVFYDTETTGTETSFDQILQFAAIRTDENLNEVERFEIRSRLSPHIVPSPGAARVTGISLEQLLDPSLPSHYEMVRAILKKLREWSPSIFVGYNSMQFDEHLLRQAFYQTLHPPYLTNTNGNCRSDAMRMAQATTLYAPNTLSVPINENNREVFRLDQLAPANGFAHEDAHEAMADVEATIHICGLIRERAPELWSNLIRFSQKAAASDYMTSESIFSLSEFYFGRAYSWLVTAIGSRPDNSSEFFVFDLATDPDRFVDLSVDELAARLDQKPKPVRRVRSNAGPILMPAGSAPSIAAATAIDLSELERRAQVLKDNQALRDRLLVAFDLTREKHQPSVHVEEQIYDGFFSTSDQTRLDTFHEVDWESRLPLVDQFEDERLKVLGQRLSYLERPDLLDEMTRQQFDQVQAKRILGVGDTGSWLTLPKAIQEADDLIAASAGKEETLLRALRDYLVERSEKAMALIT